MMNYQLELIFGALNRIADEIKQLREIWEPQVMTKEYHPWEVQFAPCDVCGALNGHGSLPCPQIDPARHESC